MVRVVLGSILLFLSVSVAGAQQGTSELRGRVMDQQGAALPGVAIVVTNQDNGTFRETVSGADGAFLLSGMTPGHLRGPRRADRLQEVPGPRPQAGSRSLGAGRDARWRSGPSPSR